jgi:GNAT superfamily N-acetyltransferase
MTVVTRTYLELRSAVETAVFPSIDAALSLTQYFPCPTSLYRELYDRVGRAHRWTDRLAWSDEQLADHLSRHDVNVWVLRVGNDLGGYFELVRHDDAAVEIAFFGLVPECIGKGLGKWLLSRAAQEARLLGATRVWLHTCTLDHPSALANYTARGFVPYKSEQYTIAD